MVYYDGGCVFGLCEVAFPKEAFATRHPVSVKNIYGDPVDVSEVKIMTKSAYLAMKNEKGGSQHDKRS